MTQPWTAEREISEEEARTLIEAQCPALIPAHLELLGVGFDNTAFLVNQQFVFRFPRRQLGAACMDAELAILPHIADTLPLPIPHPLFIGQPTEAYPWAFAGYSLLAGRTACVAALNDQQRTRLARPLAQFLARLHETSVDQALAWGAPADTLARLDAKKRVPMAHSYLERLHSFGLIAELHPFTVVVEDFLALSEEEPLRTALLHGDLYARHLLVDDANHLCGVIDWGDVHAGSVAVDLSIAHSLLPPAAQGIFQEAYGPISEADWCRARFRALYHSALVAAYGHDVGDADLVREGLISLRYIAT